MVAGLALATPIAGPVPWPWLRAGRAPWRYRLARGPRRSARRRPHSRGRWRSAIWPPAESFTDAVVDEQQAARLDLLEHRHERGLRRLEFRAHVVGDADIAGIARHQPLQPLHVLLRRQRRQQRVRSGIVGRVVLGLERDLQQHLMTVLPRLVHPVLEIAAIGAIGDADRRRQPLITSAVAPSGRPMPLTSTAMRGGASAALTAYLDGRA